MAGIESSPGSGNEDHDDKKRQPGVKRACNECRQQKVSYAGREENRVTSLLTQFSNSYDAMSCKTLFRAAHDATASS